MQDVGSADIQICEPGEALPVAGEGDGVRGHAAGEVEPDLRRGVDQHAVQVARGEGVAGSHRVAFDDGGDVLLEDLAVHQ